MVTRWVQPGRPGACRGAGGSLGAFETVWASSSASCRHSCETTPRCSGYEFAQLSSLFTRCELHSALLTHSVPKPGYECWLRVLFSRPHPPAPLPTQPPPAPPPLPPPPPLLPPRCSAASALLPARRTLSLASPRLLDGHLRGMQALLPPGCAGAALSPRGAHAAQCTRSTRHARAAHVRAHRHAMSISVRRGWLLQGSSTVAIRRWR